VAPISGLNFAGIDRQDGSSNIPMSGY